MKVIGIDIGTTGICGVAVDPTDGKLLKSVTKPNTSFIKSENAFEKIQNPEIIMQTVRDIMTELDADNSSAIGFSGQMHGILYTDKNGKAVSPLYIWQDERAAEEYKDGKSYAEYLGCFAGYGNATDFYNRENGLVPETATHFCTVADYAVMCLCNLEKPVCHITNAASLGCFDIIDNKFTIDNPMLPEVSSNFTVCGKYKEIPVSIALGDNQASFIGSVRNTGDALVNVGTGSQISWLSENPVELLGVETRPFDGKRYLAAGCALCGGRAFAMLEKFFRQAVEAATGEKIASCYHFLDRLLEEKTETTLSADSRFCGTRNDPSIRGSFSGISEDNFTPADFAYALLDAMAEELYGMFDKKATGLVCSGNGIRLNRALQKIVSKKFGTEIRIPLYEEEAAYGAALSAMTASGMCESIDESCSKIRYKDE